MKMRHLSARCAIPLMLAVLSTSLWPCCSGPEVDRFQTGREYAALVHRAVDLYCRIHPLRSSRLGMYRCDSLLFTFSPSEMETCLRDIADLAGDLSKIKTSGLEQTDMDNSILMLNWLRGEQFAFEGLALYRRNPILYCWMVEEALYGPPARLEPPYNGEGLAYRKRISRVPLLLENASVLIETAAESSIKTAVSRLQRLIADNGRLQSRAQARYGQRFEELDDARRSIESFLRFVSEELASQPRGSLILGIENFSTILQYDELLHPDPNTITSEAEKMIRRLTSEVSALRGDSGSDGSKRRIGGEAPTVDAATGSETDRRESPGGRKTKGDATGSYEERLRSLVRQMESAIPGRESSAESLQSVPPVVRKADTRHLIDLPVNPYLTIPHTADIPLLAAPAPLLAAPAPLLAAPAQQTADSPCISYIAVSGALPQLRGAALTYALLPTLSPVREATERMCEESDTVRVMLSSTAFRQAWKQHNVRDLIGMFPEQKAAMEAMLLEEQIRDLAMTVVVLRIHSGALTTEAAAQYLMQRIDLSQSEAQSAVITAAVSPEISYPGITVLMMEEMIKKTSLTKGVRNPRAEYRRVLLDHCGLPLPLIDEKIPGD